MCNCPKHPSINGKDLFRWNDEEPRIRPVMPPTLEDGDLIIFDEPGRCGESSHGKIRVDSHHLHLRLVRRRNGMLAIYALHGGGQDCYDITPQWDDQTFVQTVLSVPSADRYWFLHVVWASMSRAVQSARDDESAKWRRAILDKRVKVRSRKKVRRVEIVPYNGVPQKG